MSAEHIVELAVLYICVAIFVAWLTRRDGGDGIDTFLYGALWLPFVFFWIIGTLFDEY